MENVNFIEEIDCKQHDSNLQIPKFKDVFHGLMSREVSVKILKADGRNNAYLIRKRINPEEDDYYQEYILSFLNKEDDYHFKLKKDNSYFIFANRYYPTFKCLISHYMESHIINDACLEHAVINKSLSSVRESLRAQPCYLSEPLQDDKLKEILHKHSPGSYLFRTRRSDDNNQFVLLFFDGTRIHKIKMDLRLMERENTSNTENHVQPLSVTDRNINNDRNKDIDNPVVVLVLGRNYFDSWQDMVNNFTNNPLVSVTGNGSLQDKLVTPVNVNETEDHIEGDIYRQIKFSRAPFQKDAYSVHGEIQCIELPKKKPRYFYGSVDKDHGQLILKCGSKNTSNIIVELTRYDFVPIDFSVFQKHCLMLENKDHKVYYIFMVNPNNCDLPFSLDRKDMSEESYSYRKFNLSEHKDLYHSTDTDTEDALLSRSYDRWVMAIKRHCANTKDDIANEENPERHSKLHRYSRRIKLMIEHNSGSDINLTDSDIVAPNYSTGQSGIQLSSSSGIHSHGQFEVMYRNHLISIIPRRIEQNHIYPYMFYDLPSDISEVSVNLRIKGQKRKEYLKELCHYKMPHRELQPSSNYRKPTNPNASPPNASHQNQSSSQLPQNQSAETLASLLSTATTASTMGNNSTTGISLADSQTAQSFHIVTPDLPSSSSIQSELPAIECSATIQYWESIILPFKNYIQLCRYIMDNLEHIFQNEFFFKALLHATEQQEFKKLLDCFLYMAIWGKRQIEFLFLLIKNEFKEITPDVYFRNNNEWTRLFISYINQFADDWLVQSLMNFFEEVYTAKDVLEKNIRDNISSGENEVVGLEDPIDIWQSLSEEMKQKFAESAVCGIKDNINCCPVSMRQLFYLVHNELIKHKSASASVSVDNNDNTGCNSVCGVGGETNSSNTQHQSHLDDGGNDTGVQYCLVNNIIVLRFFCAAMNASGERRDEFLWKVKERMEKQKDRNLEWIFENRNLYTLMKEVSKIVLNCFSRKRLNHEIGMDGLIMSYRKCLLISFNEELIKPLTQEEREVKLRDQLEHESETVCRNSSLSRRFNDVLEFLTQLRQDPTIFQNSSTMTSIGGPIAEAATTSFNLTDNNNSSTQNSNSVDIKSNGLGSSLYYDLFTPQLNNIIDGINSKKYGQADHHQF